MTPHLEKIRDEMAEKYAQENEENCAYVCDFHAGFTAACDTLLPLIEECRKAIQRTEDYACGGDIDSYSGGDNPLNELVENALSKIKQTIGEET